MADANVVDLFKLCKHFYLFGKFLSQLEHRESYEVRKTLIQVIQKTIYLKRTKAVNGMFLATTYKDI